MTLRFSPPSKPEMALRSESAPSASVAVLENPSATESIYRTNTPSNVPDPLVSVLETVVPLSVKVRLPEPIGPPRTPLPEKVVAELERQMEVSQTDQTTNDRSEERRVGKECRSRWS